MTTTYHPWIYYRTDCPNLRVEFIGDKDTIPELELIPCLLIQKELAIAEVSIWDTLRWIYGEGLSKYFQAVDEGKTYTISGIFVHRRVRKTWEETSV
jgi:hypothetical protein